MDIQEVKKVITEQVENSKELSFKGDEIIYRYLDKDYIIEWDKYYNYRLGDHVTFYCHFIKPIKLHRRTQHIDCLSVTYSSIEKNNKYIITKLNILKNRIQNQLEINNFLEKSGKEAKQRVEKFIKKNLDESVDIKFWISDDWWTHRQSYPTTKIVRTFNRLNVSATVSYENIQYQYSFLCEFPCKWNDTKLKKIIMNNVSKTYQKRKQITNIIRYAKLKNIFANG